MAERNWPLTPDEIREVIERSRNQTKHPCQQRWRRWAETASREFVEMPGSDSEDSEFDDEGYESASSPSESPRTSRFSVSPGPGLCTVNHGRIEKKAYQRFRKPAPNQRLNTRSSGRMYQEASLDYRSKNHVLVNYKVRVVCVTFDDFVKTWV